MRDKFKQLPIGAIFEFWSVRDFPYSGFAHGPWIKTGKRTYRDADVNYHVKRYGRSDLRVGSVNAEVFPAKLS